MFTITRVTRRNNFFFFFRIIGALTRCSRAEDERRIHSDTFHWDNDDETMPATDILISLIMISRS